MKNSNECEDNNEEIKLDYFKKWGDRSQKTERIYIRVFPDTKERIRIYISLLIFEGGSLKYIVPRHHNVGNLS